MFNFDLMVILEIKSIFPYSSPNSTWRKDRLKKWLVAKQVDFPEKALKPELWKLAQAKEKENPRYKAYCLKITQNVSFQFNLVFLG